MRPRRIFGGDSVMLDQPLLQSILASAQPAPALLALLALANTLLVLYALTSVLPRMHAASELTPRPQKDTDATATPNKKADAPRSPDEVEEEAVAQLQVCAVTLDAHRCEEARVPIGTRADHGTRAASALHARMSLCTRKCAERHAQWAECVRSCVAREDVARGRLARIARTPFHVASLALSPSLLHRTQYARVPERDCGFC